MNNRISFVLSLPGGALWVLLYCSFLTSRFMRLLLLLFLLPLLSACDDRRDVRDFYFPVRELINTEGLVYAYENIGSLPGPDMEYWYFLGVDLDTALYLSITRYGQDNSPSQQSRERILNDAVHLDQMSLLPQDTNGIAQPVEVELIYNKVFPFYLFPEDPTPYGYRMRYTPPDDADATNYVTLNRQFRTDTVINIMGADYDAIVFDLAGEVSLRDPKDGDISPSFGGYEIYARGLGRVQFVRRLGDGETFGGRLVERVPMMEFAERMRAE